MVGVTLTPPIVGRPSPWLRAQTLGASDTNTVFVGRVCSSWSLPVRHDHSARDRSNDASQLAHIVWDDATPPSASTQKTNAALAAALIRTPFATIATYRGHKGCPVELCVGIDRYAWWRRDRESCQGNARGGHAVIRRSNHALADALQVRQAFDEPNWLRLGVNTFHDVPCKAHKGMSTVRILSHSTSHNCSGSQFQSRTQKPPTSPAVSGAMFVRDPGVWRRNDLERAIPRGTSLRPRFGV